MSIIEQATERAGGNAVLGALLAGVVSQFITPLDDPLYDWQIVRLTDVKKAIETKDAHGNVWRSLPDMIRTREFEAKINQCALAWGHRMSSGAQEPTPLAVLVWATRDVNGNLVPKIAASFYYAQSGPNANRWFARQGDCDVRVSDAIVAYLNSLNATPSGSAGNVIGVDLDDESEE